MGRINDEPTQKITDSARKTLTSLDTLQQQAYMSLKARVNLFNSNRPHRKAIKASHLLQLYHDEHIRFKKVLHNMRQRRHDQIVQRYEQDRQIFHCLLATRNKCEELGLEFIMIDESTFSLWSFNKRAWAPKGVNITHTQPWKHEGPFACAAAISSQRGLIHFQLVHQHFNANTFAEFLAGLKDKMKVDQAVILMDNCSIHRSKIAQDFLKQNGMQTVMNVPYSPQFNGIELYWAQAKRHFRMLNSQKKMGLIPDTPLEKLVEQALNSVPNDTVKRCALHAHREIQQSVEKYSACQHPDAH